MKRSSRFLIALAAAAVTFGSLTAFVGPRHWQHYRHGHCYAEADHARHHGYWERNHRWHEGRQHPEHTRDSDTSRENQ